MHYSFSSYFSLYKVDVYKRVKVPLVVRITDSYTSIVFHISSFEMIEDSYNSSQKVLTRESLALRHDKIMTTVRNIFIETSQR